MTVSLYENILPCVIIKISEVMHTMIEMESPIIRSLGNTDLSAA
jgi:hypothetical protein